MCGIAGEGSDVRAVSLVSPSVAALSQGSLGNLMFREKGLMEGDALKKTSAFQEIGATLGRSYNNYLLCGSYSACLSMMFLLKTT